MLARRLPPRTLEIFRAIPVGSRRARTQMGWVVDVLAQPAFGELRADRRRNWAAVVRILARYTDWKDRTTRLGLYGGDGHELQAQRQAR